MKSNLKLTFIPLTVKTSIYRFYYIYLHLDKIAQCLVYGMVFISFAKIVTKYICHKDKTQLTSLNNNCDYVYI